MENTGAAVTGGSTGGNTNPNDDPMDGTASEKIEKVIAIAKQQLRDGIASCGNPLFVSVRGRGLLDAIELAHPCSHAAMNWALEHGLIVNAVAPNALRLAPPLVITAQDVDQAVSILAKIPSDLPND